MQSLIQVNLNVFRDIDIDVSLKDTNNIRRTKNQLRDGLKLIDKTWLPGKFKAWLY